MSSRSGSNQHHHRSRESQQEEFPPLPASGLPSLRHLGAIADQEDTSAAYLHRPPPRQWANGPRRAARIRNLEERTQNNDEGNRYMDQTWSSNSRYSGRLRHSTSSLSRADDLSDLDRSLHEANSNLRALLDLSSYTSITNPHTSLTGPSQTHRPHDFVDDTRRSKRRKLDAERHTSGTQAFRYGRYGQVEAGQLRMEMVSCDGGMFSNESLYAAENILKDDHSVYCTKANRCNIILRHQGSTVFTVQELVIKAPTSMTYSHPIREGMIFIAMNQDDLLNRTAQYQIQYVSATRGQGTNTSSGERPHGQQDPRHVISIHHHEDGSTTTRARRSFVYRDDEQRRTPEMPHEFSSNVPDFSVTTACSGDEDEDYSASRPFRRTPNRIGSLPFETADSDDEEGLSFATEELLEASRRRRRQLADQQHHHHQYHHHHHHHHHPNQSGNNNSNNSNNNNTQGNSSLAEAWEAHANATQEAVRAVGGELLIPHVRFNIEKKKSKCTIRFDPPVSGRFILLKMWSSQHDPGGNIDIQSVITRGFAGPRYFPSLDLR